MKRLLCLVVTVPLLVAGPVAGRADAAPTCQGQPATIVGESQDHLLGTEGADVIITGSVGSVDALGGDDLVCVADNEVLLSVEAGPGDDVVDTTTADDERVFTDLGPGGDRFVGGPVGDTVTDSDAPGDSGRDVIDTGAGNDRVDTGEDGVPNHDLVDLGTGRRDGVQFHGAPGGTAHLRSDGVDYLSFDFSDQVPGTLRVDNRRGRADLDGEQLVTWDGFGSFSTEFSDVPRLVFLGGDGPESLTLSYDHPTDLDARTGGGADTITSYTPVTGSVDGGEGGRDLLVLYGSGTDLTADLGSGLLQVQPPGGPAQVVALDAVEDLTMSSFRRASLRGDRSANVLEVRGGCRATIVGRAGADQLRHLFGECDDGSGSTIRGDQGPDRMVGSRGDDLMVGGPGRDVANGRGGTDTCRSEVRRSCELR